MTTSVSIQITTRQNNSLLAQLGRQTFEEAFAAANTAADMEAYSSNAFSPEVQAKELADPQCIFWTVLVENEVIDYVK